MNSPADLLPAVQKTIATPDLPDLGPARRPGTMSADLLTRELNKTLAGQALDPTKHQLILGCALFWHDHLDPAHHIAQEIPSADGSFLHAMMHRREPDFDNAKYWFRRVGQHACYSAVARRLREFSGARDKKLFDQLLPNGQWNPFAFVDACAEGKLRPIAGPKRALLQEIQRMEFESFLESLFNSNP
jgi:hypothetical protein